MISEQEFEELKKKVVDLQKRADITSKCYDTLIKKLDALIQALKERNSGDEWKNGPV